MPRTYRKRTTVTQRSSPDDFVVITHIPNKGRRQDHFPYLEDALVFMGDLAHSEQLYGGIFELVWCGNIIATYDVVP